MSSPYVYVPHVSYQPPPFYALPSATSPYSPFIPDVNLYPSSPYTTPHHSPNIGGGIPLPPLDHSSVHFPTSGSPAEPIWDVPHRQRRPSWHGAVGSGGGWLSAPPIGHSRSHSFTQSTAPVFFSPPANVQPNYWNGGNHSPWYPQQQLPPQQKYIQPWLNGEAFRSDFLFDFSLPQFAPLRAVGPGQTVLLGQEELMQPATYPGIHRLTITCDRIPQWPIELTYNPNQTPGSPYYAPPSPSTIPPITVGDVLMMIYRHLHVGIHQIDWANLTTNEENMVARAYTRRCKNSASSEMLLRNAGVKRVDYLLDKVHFKGLVRTGEGLENLKMIVG